MMALGFLAALVNWTLLGRKEGRDSAYCSDLLFWIMLSGIAGARIAYVAANMPDFIDQPLSIIRIDQGGLIYYGGFLAAGIAIVVFAKIRGEKISGLFDFVITAVPLSHAFGRVGCFLNGCCFGKPAAGWPGGVLPVQLFEAAFNICLYAALMLFYRHRKNNGTVLAIYLLTYPIGRFLFEFLRGDERLRVGVMSVAQIVSTGLFLLGLAVFYFSRTWFKTAANTNDRRDKQH